MSLAHGAVCIDLQCVVVAFPGHTHLLSKVHSVLCLFNISAHALLNLLNNMRKRDKMRGLLSILSLFHNEFNKFNNTGAGMLYSIYQRNIALLFVKCQDFITFYATL